jgi:hypothetical protein
MWTVSENDTAITVVNRCQYLGVALYLVTLMLPIGVTSRHVDEFGSVAYGLECAVAGIASMVNMPLKDIWMTFAGWVNPLVLFSLLIPRDARLSGLARIQKYLGLLILFGLIASRLALSKEEYRPLYGYYLWVLSVGMIFLPGLIRSGAGTPVRHNANC